MTLRDGAFAINLLAAMVWTGGMVGVTVATIAARAALAPAEQVHFFRALGRRYGVVAAVALLVFAATGLSLAGTPTDWTGTEAVVAALTVLVAALTAAGVRNARAVQRLRARALQDPDDAVLAARLHNVRRAATVLRALIAAATLAAVLIAAM